MVAIYLVDTNIVIGVLRKKEDILTKYKSISEKSQPIYLTTYSISEIYLGFHNKEFKLKHAEKLKLQKELFSRMLVKLDAQKRIISLSVEDAKVLGNIFHLLKVNGTPIPIIDAIIGAIGISRKFTIITTDQNHFEIIKGIKKEVNLEFW